MKFVNFVQKFKEFCVGKLRSSPWSEFDGLQPESRIISEQLMKINTKGFLTINSQPAVNGERSDCQTVGKYSLLNDQRVLFLNLSHDKSKNICTHIYRRGF